MPEVYRDHLVDGVLQSRWHRRGDAPFGRPFSYTDALDLPTQLDKSKPWWRRLLQRRGKRPIAWAVVDGDNPWKPVEAYIMKDNSEVKVSPVGAQFLMPIYDERVILGAATLEQPDDPPPAQRT